MHKIKRICLAAALGATVVMPAVAFAADAADERPANLQPPTRSTAEALTAIDAPALGLRRPPPNLRERIELPFGLNYSRDTRSLLMQIDEKKEWGLGLNLNLNATAPGELSPPGLHLEPRRTPGLTLQKKF
jgi:hypothetical protein